MNMSPLKLALIIMPVVAGIAILFAVFSAMGNGSRGLLDSYARGEMSGFMSLGEAPPQPNVAYQTLEGEDVRLSDYRGKVILVNYWATWCGPCIEEMPALDHLQAELGGEQFEVITISLDRNLADAERWYEDNGIEHLPLLHDTQFSPGLIGGIGLPMSVLYDPYGLELGRLPAPAEWASEDAMALINAAVRHTGVER